MADDILAALGLDASNYLATLAQVQSYSDTFVAAEIASFAMLVLPPLDSSGYASSLQAITEGSQAATGASAELAAAQGDLSNSTALVVAGQTEIVSATQAAASASQQEVDALRAQVQALQATTDAQAQQIASLQAHKEASSQASDGTNLMNDALGRLGIPMQTLSPLLKSAGMDLQGIGVGGAAAATGLAAAGTAGAAVAIAGIAAATSSFLSLSDAVRETSEVTGLSEPVVQALRLGMSELGLDADSAQRSLMLFERNAGTMADQIAQGIAPTGTMAKGLHDLGINYASFAALNPDQQLMSVMDAFKAAGPEVNKTTVAFDLFGRTGATMIPILDQGSGALAQLKAKVGEAGSGVAATQEQVLAFHMATADLDNQLMGLYVTVGTFVVPVLTSMATFAREVVAVVGTMTSPLREVKSIFDSLPGPMKAIVEAGVATSIGPIAVAAFNAKEGMSLLDGAMHSTAVSAAEVNDGMDHEISRMTQDSALLVQQASDRLDVQLAAAAQAEAVNKLDQISQTAGKTNQSAALFQTQWTQALSDGAKQGSAYDDVVASLNEKIKSGTEFQKASAQAQLQLDNIVQSLGPDLAAQALAEDQASVSAAGLAAASRGLEADIKTAGAASIKFAQDLVSSDTSSAWAAQYGAAAGQIATSMHQASAEAVTTWQTANGQVLADQMSLQSAWTANASQEAIKRLQDQLTTDQSVQSSAADTATQLIADEQAYVTAVQKSVTESLSLKGQLFDNELKLSHETAAEKMTDLSTWLQAEDVTIKTIMSLEQELATATTSLARAVIEGEIALAQAGLASLKEGAREADATATQLQKDLKLDTTGINAATTAVNELTAALKAGDELAKQELDLSKQVGASKELVTASELEGLHSVTEARRGSAEEDLTATEAAQRSYLAVASAANGASTAEVNSAKAAYAARKEVSDESVTQFNDALTRETAAQSAFDSQQQASNNAAAQLSKDRVTFAKDEQTASEQLFVAVRSGLGEIPATAQLAAQGTLAAWHTADAAVLADELALTGSMSAAQRQRLDEQLKTDQAVLADAKTTSSEIIKTVQAESTAARQAQTDIRTFSQQGRTLALSDVHQTNQGAIQSYLDMANQVIGIEQQLTGTLSDDDRARLDSQLTVDKGILADRLTTAQDSIKDENDYLTAVKTANAAVLSDKGRIFDAELKLSHLTTDEKQTDLGAWLQKEIEVDSQIIELEKQLAATKDALQRQTMQSAIDDLQNELDNIKEMEREAEAAASAMAAAVQKATASTQTKSGGQQQGIDTTGWGQIFNGQEWHVASPEEIAQYLAGLQKMADTVALNAARVTALGQAGADATTQLNTLMGIFSAPTTESLGLQKQSDQLQIQIAQLEEQGVSASNPRITRLQTEQGLIDAKIKGYTDEAKASADLATVTGTLDAGTSNSITVLRSAITAATAMEEQQQKNIMSTKSLTDGTNALVTAYVNLANASRLATNIYTFQTPQSMQFPSYQAGTMSVPNDGLAFLHKGEAVIPPDLAAGKQGTPFTNVAGSINLSVPVTINGSNLSQAQLTQVATAAAVGAVQQMLGRGATLSGKRAA